jgi:hypothetical protein
MRALCAAAGGLPSTRAGVDPESRAPDGFSEAGEGVARPKGFEPLTPRSVVWFEAGESNA